MSKGETAIIELTCTLCGKRWLQLSPRVYSCCLDCWRELAKHGPDGVDPCRCDEGNKKADA